MTGSAVPGLVIAVSVDGKTVFRHGFGYADVENKVFLGDGKNAILLGLKGLMSCPQQIQNWQM